MRQDDDPEAPLLGTARPGKEGPGIVTRGILRPLSGLERFQLTREAAPEDLTPFAPFFWTVQWDLPEGESYEQAVLPFPCVNLSSGARGYEVHGPGSAVFRATLRGRGFVTGVRFTPAGFSAFSALPMRVLVDRVLPVEEALGRRGPPPPGSPAEAKAAIVSTLREQGAAYTEPMALVDRLVARAQADASIVRVDLLAREAGISPRSLHRLFERHVGVSSKWIVRRARVQDAAERVKRGEQVSWAEVASSLGYADQAHLIRDFRAQIGETPTAYAKRCAEAR